MIGGVENLNLMEIFLNLNTYVCMLVVVIKKKNPDIYFALQQHLLPPYGNRRNTFPIKFL